MSVIFSCPAKFKIRSLKDAEAFMAMRERASGDIYWSDEKRDYYLGICNDKVCVCWRWKTERDDIFSPYVAVKDKSAVQTVYRTRKYINKRYFN